MIIGLLFEKNAHMGGIAIRGGAWIRANYEAMIRQHR